MFKGLKQKIGEGIANNSTARSILALGHQIKEENSGSLKQKSSGNPELNGSSSGTGSLLDLNSPLSSSANMSFHSAFGDASSPAGKEFISRSRTSSISSQASDVSSFFSPQLVTSSQSLVFDTEGSTSEIEPENASVSKMTSLSKDDLFQMYSKVQRRGQQYKSRYLQVITGYKELEKERDKLMETLSNTQDKALRRISELKEQAKLDNLAKKDLESHYSMMLEEKDEVVKSLNIQVNLLKEGKEIPEELLLKCEQQSKPQVVDKDLNSNLTSDETVLREKVKRLEHLLTKCKETITMNKERIQGLSADRESILKQLDSKTDELHKLRESTVKFQTQLNEARKVIEDLESDKQMAVASTKQELHKTLETKETELVQTRQKMQTLYSENVGLKENIQKLEQAGQIQVKELLETVDKLKEEKLRLEEDMMKKFETSEHNLEKEKDTELQELRRGKVEALHLLQKQMQDRVSEFQIEKDKALAERDQIWEEKWVEREKAKRKEFEREMAEKQEEMMLAIEEQELQKMAAVKLCDSVSSELRNRCDLLVQEKRELQIKFDNYQQDTASKMKEIMEQIEESAARNKERLQELSDKHETVMQESRLDQQRQLEALRVEYSVKNEELILLNERKLQETTSEMTAVYEKIISDSKEMHEAKLKDYQLQMHQAKQEIQTIEENRGDIMRSMSSAKEREDGANDEISRLKSTLAELSEKNALLLKENELIRIDLSKSLADAECLKSQMDSTQHEVDKKQESSVDTINRLEQRINDLMERENHLNTELEQTKVDNERNLMLQDSELRSLRELTNNLKQSELSLKDQLDETNRHFQAELARINMDNMTAMSQFSSLLQDSQSEMSSVLGELIETKQTSNEIVSKLERELEIKTATLQDAYKRLEETERILHSRSCKVEKVTNVQADCSKNNDGVDERDGCKEIENETADEEQNNLTDQQLLQRISELERFLREKDQAILWFESKVKDFGIDIQRETQEMKERSRQVELMIADKDELLKEKVELNSRQSVVIADQEKKIRLLESSMDEKMGDFEELQAKFWQLQSEAKSRIVSLKSRLVEKDEALRKGITLEKETDIPERILQLQEEFTIEKNELEEKHKKEMKRLGDEIEKERNNLSFFKEGVKKQFDERQMKVKFMMEKMRESCEQSLLDRDSLLEIKLANLERDKNTEKQHEIRDLMVTIEKLKTERDTAVTEALEKQTEEFNFLKAELESARVCHRQAMAQHQAEKEALLKYMEGDGEVLERLKQLEAKVNEDEVLESSGTVQVKLQLQTEIDSLLSENNLLKEKISSLECSHLVAIAKSDDPTSGKIEPMSDKVQTNLDEDAINLLMYEKLAAENEELKKELEKLKDIHIDITGKLQLLNLEKLQAIEVQHQLESEKMLNKEKLEEMKSVQNQINGQQLEMETLKQQMIDESVRHQSEISESKNCYSVLQEEMKKLADHNSGLEKIIKDLELQKENHSQEIKILRLQLQADVDERFSSKEMEILDLKRTVDDKEADRLKLMDTIQELELRQKEFEQVIAKLQAGGTNDLRSNENAEKEIIEARQFESKDQNLDSCIMLTGLHCSVTNQSISKVCEKITVSEVEKTDSQVLNVDDFQLEQLGKQQGDSLSNDFENHKEIRRLHLEYKAKLQEMEDDHNSKVIQLIKDFNIQIAEREKEVIESYQQQIDSLESSESRLRTEHKHQMHDINQQLREMNEKNDAQINAVEMKHASHIEKLNLIIEELQQSLLDKEHEWMTRKDSLHQHEMAAGSQLLANSCEIEQLHQQIRELTTQLGSVGLMNNTEPESLSRELLLEQQLIPDLNQPCTDISNFGHSDVFRNANSQVNAIKMTTQNTTPDQQSHTMSYKFSQPSFLSSHDDVTLLTEATELEYLKNVLFKYMLGLETKTLARVICTVMKFSDDEMRKVLEKEESRNSIFSPSHR